MFKVRLEFARTQDEESGDLWAIKWPGGFSRGISKYEALRGAIHSIIRAMDELPEEVPEWDDDRGPTHKVKTDKGDSHVDSSE